jgi:hypothetical protein
MSERVSQAIGIGISFGLLAGVVGLLARQTVGASGALAPLALAVGVGLISAALASWMR